MDTAELATIASDHRVHRTFAFIDLCGFTDFVDDHGDDGAVRELRNLRASLSGGPDLDREPREASEQ